MPKVLIHLDDGLRRTLDPEKVAHLEATAGDTRIRRLRGKALRDVRSLAARCRTPCVAV